MKFQIVGESYGRLAVIAAASPKDALDVWVSWYASPDGPQVNRDSATTAHFTDDGEKVTVKR